MKIMNEADVLINKLLPFVENYTDSLNTELTQSSPGMTLSKSQKFWLGFCITGIILTSSINWAAFSRISVGQYKTTALSWMFRHSKIAWSICFISALKLFSKYMALPKVLSVLMIPIKSVVNAQQKFLESTK